MIYKHFLVSIIYLWISVLIICSITCQSIGLIQHRLMGMLSTCERAYCSCGRCKTRQATFPIIGCSEQRAARGDLVTFHCHGNSLQVTLGKLRTATPIYSPGLTPDEPWRMSGQDRGGHTRRNTPTQQRCLHGYYGQQHDSWSIWTQNTLFTFSHLYSCVYNVSWTGQT